MSPVSDPGRTLNIEDRIQVPERVFDLDGYRAWVKSEECPEGVRTSYVGGEVLIEMSPEGLERHNKVKTAITAAVAAFVQDRDLGEVYSDRTLVTNEAAGLSGEPDLTFVSWAPFDDRRVDLVAQAGASQDYVELVGSPDLVVEIVSDRPPWTCSGMPRPRSACRSQVTHLPLLKSSTPRGVWVRKPTCIDNQQIYR